MGWTILVTAIAALFFYLAKSKRDSSGSVRTPQGYAFAVSAIIAALLWIFQILGGIC